MGLKSIRIYKKKPGLLRDQASVVIETQEVRGGHIGYTDNIHLLYMELLSMGVSVAKCSKL